MSSLSVFVLAVGLAMDATAVAGARGLAATKVRLRDALLVALLFGAFQGAMPILGGTAGAAFAAPIAGWGHWVAFVLLVAIGAKMLHEARAEVGVGIDVEARATARGEVFGLKVLALLAIATSIDALAAGIPLALAGVDLVGAGAIIGIVTAVLSFAGVLAGHRFGARLGKRLEVLGGLVLIGLGVKALVDHYLGR
jgi:manganese efflux pump family protein